MKEEKKQKIKSFTDLIVWQEGHKLVIMVYKATDDLPKKEMYSLTDQMRRAVISLTSNIAEGFGRQTYKDKLRFYYLAQGSLIELKNQILIAKDIGYLENEQMIKLAEQANKAHALLQGFIKKTKTFL